MPWRADRVDLSEYPDRAPGSDRYYVLVEEAVHCIAVLHDAERAVRTIESAIEGFVASRDARGEARARAKAAIVFRKAGIDRRAASEAAMAMKALRGGLDSQFFAIAALEFGQVLEAVADFGGAAAAFYDGLMAIETAEESASDEVQKLRAFLQDCIANVLGRKGESRRAISLRKEALPVFERLGLSHDAATCWTNVATDHITLYELAEAASCLEQARRCAGRLDPATTEARRCAALISLAGGRLANARLDREPNAHDSALADSRREHGLAQSIYDQIGDAIRAATAALNMARVEIAYGSVGEAFTLLAYAAKRLPLAKDCTDDFSRSLRLRLDRLHYEALAKSPLGPTLNEALPDGIASHRGIAVSVSDSPFVPAGATAEPVSQPEALLPFTWARIDPERALLEIENRKAVDLLQRIRDRHNPTDPNVLAALTIEDVDRSLPQPSDGAGLREAFVDYYTGDHMIALLQFAGEKARVFELDVAAREVADCVSMLRQSFDGGGMRLGIDRLRPQRVSLDFVNALGRRLMPFFDALKQADLVCVFPHGPLHNFPFHAVCDESGEPLIARAAVAYGVSRRLLAVQRSPKPGRERRSETERPRNALVVSVQAIDEPRPELFEGDGAFLETLGLQVRALETVVDATVPRVLEAMKRCHLVHFNCHGLFSFSNPLDSTLLLTDGREGPRRTRSFEAAERVKHLSARTLLGERADVSTVVLRVCSSGVTNVRAGDEQEGLLRAFLHLGAARCVVTRWKVDAESSRGVIRSMYRHWLQEPGRVSIAVALKRAQLDMLAGDVPHYRHPYHWAPFIIVGDWH